MNKDSLEGLSALPCPAVYLGDKIWLNDAMAQLASGRVIEEIFKEGGEKTSQILLCGRRFAVMRSEKDPALILLSEQLPHSGKEAYSETLIVRLRTALAGGVMAAELLTRQPLSEKGRLQLGEVRKSMAQVERVSDNLYVSALDSVGNKRAINTVEMVKELFDKAASYLPAEKAVAYEFTGKEKDPFVVSRRDLIETYLLNLMAELLLKNTQESRVRFRLRLEERVSFSYIWEKPGVPAEKVEKLLFDAEGQGTGWEAVRHAAELLGGYLFVKTQADVLTVTMILRRDEPSMHAIFSPEEKYGGYDHVRMMLSDVLGRNAFAEDNSGERT